MTRRIFCKVLLLVVIAIFGVLVLSSVLSAQGRSDWAFEHVKDVQERNTNWLMAIDGVEGTAIGLNMNDRRVVKVFTAEPGVAGIPQELEGVPVQPVVTGKFYALPKPPDTPGKGPGGGGGGDDEDPVDPTSRFERPVPIGVSTGHPDITAGTIGCRVTKGGNVYSLSNNHVYADENNASTGDNVLQPGPYDGGTDPADAIGTLHAFVTIDFAGGNNIVDAAIALSSTANLRNATPSDGYGAPSTTTVGPRVRERVQKYGRTTGLTKGKIDAINATVDVGYSTGVARFVGQIIISPGNFSAGGDSGSLIVTQKGKNPVGLLFAGSFFFTVANPIDDVLSAFDVTIDGE